MIRNYLNAQQVAEKLGISKQTLLRYEKRGVFPLSRRNVVNKWREYTEGDIVAFNVLRSEDGSEYVSVNPAPIIAERAGLPLGATYHLMDVSVRPGARYTYLLEILRQRGGRSRYPLATVVARWWLKLPLVRQ